MNRLVELAVKSNKEQLMTCLLSWDLFNFVLESVLRKPGLHRNGTIFQKSVQLLAYADYIDIIGRDKWDVTAAFSAIER